MVQFLNNNKNKYLDSQKKTEGGDYIDSQSLDFKVIKQKKQKNQTKI